MSVRHSLLALLSDGPRYGLQLRQEFEAGTGEVWPLNVGQVYTTLQRLERDGLITSDEDADEGAQRHYRITPEGAAEVTGWLRLPSDAGAPPPRDELVIKVLVARWVPGIDVHDVLQVHRRALVEVMQQYTRLKEDLTDDEVALALVVDAELFRLDGVLRWLDAAEGRLQRGANAPVRPAPEPSAPTRMRRRAARVRAAR